MLVKFLKYIFVFWCFLFFILFCTQKKAFAACTYSSPLSTFDYCWESPGCTTYSNVSDFDFTTDWSAEQVNACSNGAQTWKWCGGCATESEARNCACGGGGGGGPCNTVQYGGVVSGVNGSNYTSEYVEVYQNGQLLSPAYPVQYGTIPGTQTSGYYWITGNLPFGQTYQMYARSSTNGVTATPASYGPYSNVACGGVFDKNFSFNGLPSSCTSSPTLVYHLAFSNSATSDWGACASPYGEVTSTSNTSPFNIANSSTPPTICLKYTLSSGANSSSLVNLAFSPSSGGGGNPNLVLNQWYGLVNNPATRFYVNTLYSGNATFPGDATSCPASSTLYLKRSSAASNQLPKGYVDQADCSAISGWTCDPDSYDSSLSVTVSTPGFQSVTYPAANQRPDLVNVCGPNSVIQPHGFSITTDAYANLRDGGSHPITVSSHDIDSLGNQTGQTVNLANGQGVSGIISCPPPSTSFFLTYGGNVTARGTLSDSKLPATGFISSSLSSPSQIDAGAVMGTSLNANTGKYSAKPGSPSVGWNLNGYTAASPNISYASLLSLVLKKAKSTDSAICNNTPGDKLPIINNLHFYCYGSSSDSLDSYLTTAITSSDPAGVTRVFIPEPTFASGTSQKITAKNIGPGTNTPILFFVPGDLTVSGNITVSQANTSTGLMGIIGNDLKTDGTTNVTNLDGAYVFFNSFYDFAADSTHPLTGTGQLIGPNSRAFANSWPSLGRNVSNGAGETFTYDPRYLILFKKVLSSPKYLWKELPPQ